MLLSRILMCSIVQTFRQTENLYLIVPDFADMSMDMRRAIAVTIKTLINLDNEQEYHKKALQASQDILTDFATWQATFFSTQNKK